MDLSNRALSRIVTAMRRPPGAAVAGAVLLVMILSVAACSGQAQGSVVKPTWVKPQVSGETLSISASDVTNDTIVHFPVSMALGTENFMAYSLGGKVYVRANVCPPCRSVGFSLNGDRLVCQTCGTIFKAQTGDGVSGACVALSQGGGALPERRRQARDAGQRPADGLPEHP